VELVPVVLVLLRVVALEVAVMLVVLVPQEPQGKVTQEEVAETLLAAAAVLAQQVAALHPVLGRVQERLVLAALGCNLQLLVQRSIEQVAAAGQETHEAL
jgi:hypothetical protein